MNEVKFMESPEGVLGEFREKIEAIAKEFASMGGTFVCAMSIKDDLAQVGQKKELAQVELMDAFAIPFDFAARGLSDALAGYVSFCTDFDFEKP